MTHTKRWSVDIYIDEHEESRRTRAEARLHTSDRTDLRGVGTSSRNPGDREVPEIGDELAVSRALADLAEHLHTAVRLDVVENSDQPTRE
jgi:Rv2632c-like